MKVQQNLHGFTFASLFFLITMICLGACASSNQYRGGPAHGMPSKPGSCFAKCFIQSLYSLDTIKYFEFTGDSEMEKVRLEQKEFEIKSASTKWIKKKADRNCLSKDPNDCLVWCLVEVPAQYVSKEVMTDTSQSKHFKESYFIQKTLVKKGGMTEWREVVCQGKITKEMVAGVTDVLSQSGYLQNEETINSVLNPKLTTEVKAALVKYQRDNDLPVGQLDFETLDALGIAHD